MSRPARTIRVSTGRPSKERVRRPSYAGMRRMVVRGEDWHWRFGRDVRIVDPEGRRHDVPLTTFSGMDWNGLERAEWKGNAFDATPRRIRDWIDRRILGYTDEAGFPRGAIPKDWTFPLGQTWNPIAGPRGIWRWRLASPNVEIASPEEVVTFHRVYDVTGQGVEAFFAAQRAALTESGVDLSLRVEDPIGQTMNHPLPAGSRPTDRHVYDFVVGTIVAPRPAPAAESEDTSA